MTKIIDKGLKKLASTFLEVEKMEDQREINKRMDICRSCQYFDTERQKCNSCGCFMEVKTTLKVNFNPVYSIYEETHCPHGFWNDKHLVEKYQTLYKKPFFERLKESFNKHKK